MTRNHDRSGIPDTDEVVEAIRTGLVRLLPPEDLALIDLPGLDAGTAMLHLPVDSAVLMALMTELEDTFSVFIEEEAAFSFTDLGDVAGYIKGRIADRAEREGNQ
jgi:acyl carrier protein